MNTSFHAELEHDAGSLSCSKLSPRTTNKTKEEEEEKTLESSDSSSLFAPEMEQHDDDERAQPTTKEVQFWQHVYVYDGLHISEYTSQEITAAWYNDDDFEEFTELDRPTIRLLSQNAYPGDTPNVTARGLEIHGDNESIQRILENKEQALEAVIREQERQWNVGYENPQDIALAYSQYTPFCVRMARQLAQQDEAEVSSYFSTSSSSLPPLIERGTTSTTTDSRQNANHDDNDDIEKRNNENEYVHSQEREQQRVQYSKDDERMGKHDNPVSEEQEEDRYAVDDPLYASLRFTTTMLQGQHEDQQILSIRSGQYNANPWLRNSTNHQETMATSTLTKSGGGELTPAISTRGNEKEPEASKTRYSDSKQERDRNVILEEDEVKEQVSCDHESSTTTFTTDQSSSHFGNGSHDASLDDSTTITTSKPTGYGIKQSRNHPHPHHAVVSSREKRKEKKRKKPRQSIFQRFMKGLSAERVDEKDSYLMQQHLRTRQEAAKSSTAT